jgi:hypothetical protein
MLQQTRLLHCAGTDAALEVFGRFDSGLPVTQLLSQTDLICRQRNAWLIG